MSETTAAPVKPEQSLAQRQERINALTSREWTPAQVDVIRNTVAKGATNDELALFLAVAGRTGLDPFTKQIHLVKRWDSKAKAEVMAIQVGIDGFRVLAQRTDKLGARLGPWWCGPDGKWREVWLEDAPPAAARVGIIRRDFSEPVFAVARYSAYVQTTRDGDPNSMWKKMDAEQLAKCAEALALRVAFPNDISGLHTDDELPSENGDRAPLTATDYNERERARLAAESAPAKATTARADAALGESFGAIAPGTPIPAQPAADDPRAEFVAIGERTGRKLTGKGSGQAMAAWTFAIWGYGKLKDAMPRSVKEVTPAQWVALRDAARAYEQEKSGAVEVGQGDTTEATAGPTEPESENPAPSLEQQGEEALETIKAKPETFVAFCEMAERKFAAAGTPREFLARSGAMVWYVDGNTLDECNLDAQNGVSVHKLDAADRLKLTAAVERTLDKLAARKAAPRGPMAEGRLL